MTLAFPTTTAKPHLVDNVQGHISVVAQLALQAGVLQQRGSRRKLPLSVARSACQADLISFFIDHGAPEL